MLADSLRGIRFTDLTWAGAGAFATKVFSDCGAEVLKVESMARPDPVRVTGPFKDKEYGINRSGYFASRNTGKRSVAVNLKTEEGREIVLRLIEQSDVVSNNFGPGAMHRLGLDYDMLAARKPDIIYLAMPMYGDHGPAAALLGVGMTISAVTGLMLHTAYGPDDAVGPGTHYPDHAANPYHAAFAVLAALRHRRRTGRGMKIDLSQVASTLNFLGPEIVEASVARQDPIQHGNRSKLDAPHNVFRCACDDNWCAIAVEGDAAWRALVGAIGRDDLARDASLATAQGRLAAVERLEAAVAEWTRGRAADQVEANLRAVGIPAAVVASSRSLIEIDPQLAARDFWTRVEHPELGNSLYTSPPYVVDGERIGLERPPLFGEHTDETLAGLLSIPADEIARLRADGTLG